MFSMVHNEVEIWYKSTGEEMARCILVAEQEPEESTLEITGADVDELNDNAIIARGSVLLTPTANYIALTDGVLTKKG